MDEWFCQLVMWQKMLTFGKLLFLASFKGRSSLGWHWSSISKIWAKVKLIRCYEQWNWYHLFQIFSQKDFFGGTPVTKGVRCVDNNKSLLHTTHIILIIDLVMANTHPKSQSTKRLVVGLSGKNNGKLEEVKTPGRKKLKVLPVGVGICYLFTTQRNVKNPSFKQVKDVVFTINEQCCV